MCDAAPTRARQGSLDAYGRQGILDAWWLPTRLASTGSVRSRSSTPGKTQSSSRSSSNDGEERLFVIGPDLSGNLLKLVAVPAHEPTRIIHAERLRPKFYDAL